MANTLKRPPLEKTSLIWLWVCLGLALATAFAYWPVSRHEFIGFDDDLYVTENYQVQQGLTASSKEWAFTTTEGGNWHPITWLSHMLDVELFGMKPGAHHLTNLFLHVLNTVLLFMLFRKMTGALGRSAFVAALFALHPMHVESVAWIAERKDLLSGLFGILAIWFYVRFVAAKETITRNGSSLNYVLALLFFALGLMSKAILVTLPFVLLLLDFWPLRRWQSKGSNEQDYTWRAFSRLLIEKIPFFVLTLVFSVVTYVAQQKAGAMASTEQMGMAHRIGNALVAFVLYLIKLVWPRDLAVLYPIQIWPVWKIVGAAVLLIAISLAAWRLARRRPYFLLGWLWFLGVMVPVIGLVHVGSQAMADRYTYLSYTGLFVIVAWGGFDLLRSRKLPVAVGLVVIAACLALTRVQIPYWKNSEILFRHALSVTKGNVLMLNNLASELITQGRLDEAIVLLEEAIALNPNLPNTLSNLGSVLERKGRTDEALELYQRAIKISPNNPQARNNLGFLLLVDGRYNEAAEHFKAALSLRPTFPESHYNLGNIYFLHGGIAEALPHYEAAVRYRPEYPEAQSNLGYALLKLGKPEKALSHLQIAVRLKPDYAQAYNNLAEVLLQLGEHTAAETHARKALELQGQSPVFQNTLGLTLAAQKKWAEAEAIYSNALQKNPQVADLYVNRASSRSGQGRFEEAKADYREALKLQPLLPDAHMQLAMLLIREGKNVEALDHFKKVLETHPDSQLALNNVAWILATDSHAEVRNGKEAVRIAQRAVELSGEDVDTLDTLAAAYAEDGQFEKAVESATKAAALAEKTNSPPALTKQIETRLQSYKQQIPWREP